jgi:MOSC domain-containing protein YiiM
MPTPTLLSIQVGQPATRGADAISKKDWTSGIFKAPVSGRVWLGKTNLAGDGQADLKNHGGPYRAALAYGASRYPAWREELGMPDLPYGAFGENFTVSELTEENVCIGDIYQMGDAQVQVTQPRYPCWKLGRRWGIKALTTLVLNKAQGGWYNRVLQEGFVEAGMTVTLLERPYPQFPIRHVFALLCQWMEDPEAAAGLAVCQALSPEWRRIFYGRAFTGIEDS